jgi:hypothetical protein
MDLLSYKVCVWNGKQMEAIAHFMLTLQTPAYKYEWAVNLNTNSYIMDNFTVYS